MNGRNLRLSNIALGLAAALLLLGTAFMNPQEGTDEFKKWEHVLKDNLGVSFDRQRDATKNAAEIAALLTKLRGHEVDRASALEYLKGNYALTQQTQLQLMESQDKILDSIHVLSGTPSPIKVRGGSMTVFTADTKWANGDGSTATPFCSMVDDAKKIEFQGSLIAGVTLPWTMEIHGMSPDDHLEPSDPTHYRRFDASPRGIKLIGRGYDCNGHTGPNLNSVTLESFGGPKAGFYSIDLKPSGAKKSDNKRFRDESDECIGNTVDGPTSATPGKGDREVCERMSGLVLTFGTATVSKTCLDGDCDILVGTP
jgi:hypothetical protein